MRHITLALLFSVLVACGGGYDEAHGPFSPCLGQLQDGVTANVKVSIHPKFSGNLCLATSGDEVNSPVTLALCSEDESQRWARFDNEIRGPGDKCLVVDGEAKSGASVVLGDCETDTTKSHWSLVKSTFRVGGDKPLCLEVLNADFKAGAELQLYDCTDDEPAQQFGWVFSADDAGSMPYEETHSQPRATTQSAPKEKERAARGRPASEKEHAPKDGKDKKAEDPKAKPASGHKGEKAQLPKEATDDKKATGQQQQLPVAGGTFGASPSGVLVAPYFYAWDSAGCTQWLVDAKKEAGLKAATMAFGLSGGGCNIKGFSDYAKDIQSFQAQGGTFVLSFGGQAGTYVQNTCTDVQQLAEAFLAQSKTYNTKLLDFDVEGDNLENKAANQRLVQALAIVQKQQPDTYISFTLPVDPDAGLPANALALLDEAQKAGLRPSRINIMAMDYGRKPKAGQTVGDLAISAAQATAKQMLKIWPKASHEEILHAVGVTPMIGQNDGNQDSPFLPSDASKLAQWSKANGVGHLAYWAFQRDVAKKGDYNDHSNSQSTDYEYYHALLAAE